MGGNNTTVNNTTTVINTNQDSPNPPTPNFVDTMLNWANNLVTGSPFPVTGDPNKDLPTLQKALVSINQAVFLNQYQYGWNGPATNPPTYDGGNVFQPLSDFTNVAQNQVANISLYVTTSVFPTSSTIPGWALRSMRADLDTWIQQLSSQTVIDGWQIAPYSAFYRNTTSAGGPSIKVDAGAIYTIIPALDENGNPQITMFLSFVGVYYSVASTLKLVS